ncbi:MAG TPA: hypothetical protein ENI05_09395 [Porticoccus sp.]|nr:hypothetical protein [Porticoccus sp.]
MINLWHWLFAKPQTRIDRPYGFRGTADVVSYNPSLSGPYTTNNALSIIQAVPDGWQIHNNLVTADGVSDKYSDYARITTNGFGLTIQPHNEVRGINGKWGYSQDVELSLGCYLLKVTGYNWVNNPPDPHNFVISGYVNNALISQQRIPPQSGFELIYPFKADVPSIYTIKWMIEALWATAGHNSKIDILGAGVLKVDDGYCADIS